MGGRNLKTIKKEEEVLLRPKQDRRLLSKVPDPERIRFNHERRGRGEKGRYIKYVEEGTRYQAAYEVDAVCILPDGVRRRFRCKSVDVSTSGIQLEIAEDTQRRWLEQAREIRLRFAIAPGTMPEGYEMPVRIKASLVRTQRAQDKTLCGLQFCRSLSQYARSRGGRYKLFVSTLLLLAVTLFIVLMRVESVIYFQFNKYLYLYSIIAAAFLLSRYFFGSLYRETPVDMEFTPGVTIIIPCFNEEEWIERTIMSCVNQDYPVDCLEILVVDDCSSDRSVKQVKKTIEKLKREAGRYKIEERVRCVVQERNQGKREALARGALMAKHELVVFVDSDSFLDPYAIRNLVQPFKDPKMGGVSGRTDVANTYTNALTKMQSVRYYIAFRIMKAAEAYFDAVTCLSGPLSCYRKQIILDHRNEWLAQRFLGQKATFGDDRSMTNFVLRRHRTGYQDSAICHTIVPSKYKVFLRQQMRWKRSWLRESIIAAGFMWRKEPFMAVSFYMGLVVPIAAPVVVAYNLLYVPLAHQIFPTTFLVGILMMSLLMSVVQLFLRKSTTWLFGLLFCLYYEAVLLWQMPIAWVTFWKATWGTRMTPQDVEAENRRQANAGFMRGRKEA